jgi:arylsulfatase
MLMSIDESFDVGLDSHTGIDHSYELPFKFTGTIDKPTFKLGPSQMSEAEQKTAAGALVMAHD